MLSILIPIYNYDCRLLILELRRQAALLQIPYEIIAVDDASAIFREENKKALAGDCCKYIELEKNIGRSAIRNRLAKEAAFEYLIFMDCDTFPLHNDYLKRYVEHIQESKVICGGCFYEETDNPEIQLRFIYGKNREAVSVSEKSNNPYCSFSSFNFLIRKELFQAIQFNEGIKGYGHEDTWFGFELKKKEEPVLYIENQLIHNGLDKDSIFLEKSKNGVRNLLNLYLNQEIKPYIVETRILQTFQKIKKARLTCLFASLYRIFSNTMERNLMSIKPNLFVFDMYRLTYLCFLYRNR